MPNKYTDAQRQQAARRIVSDLEVKNGPAPQGATEQIASNLDDTDIGYALGEIQGKKHAKNWEKTISSENLD